MTKKQLYKQLKLLAKEYKVKLRVYHNYSNIRGYAHPKKSKVQLNMGKQHTISDIASTFCHELSHILDYRDGLFRFYMRENPSARIISKWAVKAERHADWRAKKLLKTRFPSIKYSPGYGYSDDRQWLLKAYYKV